MDVRYSPRAQQLSEGFVDLEQATKLLKDILGPQSQELVKAEWDCVQDNRDRTLCRLTIRDATGEASTDFTPDELRYPLHMRVRLYRLWGDLLQVRSNRQHQQV